ncbi:MAG: DeoR/GlpR family DNA-binding transcription regulator [Methylophilus sp.]|jgi:DeoR/GlpR family transcriptional regulator of sugar metabolism
MKDHLAERRLEMITSVLHARGECRTRQLAEQFNLSEMTVRRDLHELEQRGLLRRVHGGAVLLNSDVNYTQRLQFDQLQKKAIGRTATNLLRSGQTVYIDAGTTTLEMARAIRQGLPHITHLNIVTHGITIASELAGQTPYNVHLIGGDVYQNALSTVGPVALEQINKLHIDTFFMGAVAVSNSDGWGNSNHVEVMVKRAVLERSKQTFALVDSAKWKQESYAKIVDFAVITKWIVNRGLAVEAVEAAKAAKIVITYADGT